MKLHFSIFITIIIIAHFKNYQDRLHKLWLSKHDLPIQYTPALKCSELSIIYFAKALAYLCCQTSQCAVIYDILKLVRPLLLRWPFLFFLKKCNINDHTMHANSGSRSTIGDSVKDIYDEQVQMHMKEF